MSSIDVNAVAPAATSEADVLAQYPKRFQKSQDAPVRDALVGAQYELLRAHDSRASYASTMVDPTRAEGIYLDVLGADREIDREPAEDDETYRRRMLAPTSPVSPVAVVDAVNAVLAKYTARRAVAFETIMDRAYLAASDDEMNICFLSDDEAAPNPTYASRYYEDRPWLAPGGAWLADSAVGRTIVLRVPVLSDAVPFYGDFFMSDEFSLLGSSSASVDSIYAEVVRTTEDAVADGVQVIIFPDERI